MLTLKKRPAKQEPSKPATKPTLPEQRVEECNARKADIGTLAYQKWQEAGCPVSDGVEFWLAAEREILGGK